MLDARRERFAQHVASGFPATVAFQESGYSGGYGRNALKVQAHRLRWHPKVSKRIGELMAETAEKSKYTRQWLLEQLEAAMEDAGESKHSGARVSALSVMSRILGEDKTTIRDERPDPASLKPDFATKKQPLDPRDVVEAVRSDPDVASAIAEAGKTLDAAGETEFSQAIATVKASEIVAGAMDKKQGKVECPS